MCVVLPRTCVAADIKGEMSGMDVTVSTSCALTPCAFGVRPVSKVRVLCHNSGRQSAYEVRTCCKILDVT